MPKFHSATHDLDRLQQHLTQLQHGTTATASSALPEPLRRLHEAWHSKDATLQALIESTAHLCTVHAQAHLLQHTRLQQLEQQVRALQERVAQHEHTPHAAASAPASAPADAPVSAPDDAWYSALEETLRGSTADIAQRQQHYLQFVREALAHIPAADAAPVQVLDLGCGRGEWLAQLQAQGLRGSGVDTDAAMLAHAHAQGVQVHQADVLTHLSAQADASIGAITAFQVVEHLPVPTLLHLLREAYRVLSPGGILILETPNPENIQVGAYSFWLDPTHQRPLPPPLLFTLARHYGYERLHIERCAAWAQHTAAASAATLPDPHLAKILYCEQDYALIAYKPQPAAAH